VKKVTRMLNFDPSAMISSGLIPELAKTYQRKIVGLKLTGDQIEFLISCALNPELAQAQHIVSLQPKTGMGFKMVEKHPTNPATFAKAFLDDPSAFVKVLSTAVLNASKRRGSAKYRARRAAGELFILATNNFKTGTMQIPNADEIVARAGRPFISQKTAEAARTELSEKIRLHAELTTEISNVK
jgi:hypothetical protein